MNALQALSILNARLAASVRVPAVLPATSIVRYRERDFGVGYGNSSGYADGKRYTSDWGAPRFRCG